MKKILRPLKLAAFSAAGALSFSCAHVGNNWIFGTKSAAANDQIMLVRKEPPSFGFQRLTSQSVVYPDLGLFVRVHGLPDFLAETANQDRQYFILYYLRERHAFACRTRGRRNQAVEFAGPYPITDRENRLLQAFRRDPSQRPATF